LEAGNYLIANIVIPIKPKKEITVNNLSYPFEYLPNSLLNSV
jgi:hypothetical protein